MTSSQETSFMRMALEELTADKYLLRGDGQVRT